MKCLLSCPDSHIKKHEWGGMADECVATPNPNPVTDSQVWLSSGILEHAGQHPQSSWEHFSMCVCACLLRSYPTPGEQNRRVYKLNTNNIHRDHFSFRWLAVMSSTSKACFICGISGNKGFGKYGKQTLDSVQTCRYLWNLCHALLQSLYLAVRYMCIYCVCAWMKLIWIIILEVSINTTQL